MYKYTLAVTSSEYWNTIHNSLIVDSNEDGIPDRKVDCSDTKEHSPTRGTYWLTHEEATGISTHPQVKWIELSPSDYRYSYPEPEPDTKRFRTNVKVYRDLGSNAPPASATSAELNRTNWAVKRVGIKTNGDSWPNVTGNPAVINTDISYSLTGKNVDLVIQDSGVLQYHPEFIDDDGKSRVRDIILDGPYYIDPSYFISNGLTYTKPDGRTGITTSAAHNWWENSSNRSGSFSSVGTIAVPDAYTVANSLGIGGTSHTMTSSHGTGCAGLSAGRNFGLAFEANIWTISIFAPADISTEASYDALKIFHQNKPETAGRKNPTVVNGSWGYFAGFNSNTTVSYRFKGAIGSFTGYASNSTGVQALAYGLNGGTSYDRQFATSSRSNSIETAGDEMVDAGVIFVTSAGNSNQRLGLGLSDPHLNDVLTTLNSADARTGVPSSSISGTVPSGHRNYIHPANVGYNTTTDYHQAVCVGAMDDFIESDYQERKASYSNNGPGVDVFAPADETLSAGMRASNGDQLGSDTNYNRYNSDFVDMYFNGTSAASPVVAGVVALFLESKPSATSAEVKNFIRTQASQMLPNTEWSNPYPTDNDAEYWRDAYNNRGAANRVVYDPTASDARPTFAGVIGGENIITSGLVLNLDGNNYTSGTTWTDTSGQGNNGTLVGGTGYSSDNGGYLIFDGTDDKVTMSAGSDFAYGTGDFTVEIWFNVTGPNSEAWGEVLFAQTASGQNYFVVNTSEYNPTQKKPGFIFGGGQGTKTSSSSTYTQGIWHHFVVTRNGTTVTLYLDNSIEATVTANYNFNNTTYVPTIAGSTHDNGINFTGKIAQVRVYKGKGFSASDVQHNFDAMKGRYLDNPLILSGISYSLT